MKKTAILGLIIMCSVIGRAQIIPNMNFEAWTPSGEPEPFDWEEPTDWISNNATVEFISAGITKSTDSYEGEYAAKLKSTLIFGESAPGVLVNGTGDLNYGAYTVDIITAGTPCSIAPLALHGFYKYTSETETDSAYIEIILKKYNTELDKIDTLSISRKRLGFASEYEEFSVNIEDVAETPDSIIVAFYSTSPILPQTGGELWIDHFYFEVLGIAPIEMGQVFFPNPTKGVFYLISIADYQMIEVMDISGKVVLEHPVTSEDEMIDLTAFKQGVYFVKLIGETKQEKVVKIIKQS